MTPAREQEHRRTVEWLTVTLLLAAMLVTMFALVGSLSTGTSLAVLSVLAGTFVLAIGAMFGRQEKLNG
jgi:purine-cytosine permease-like protein